MNDNVTSDTIKAPRKPRWRTGCLIASLALIGSLAILLTSCSGLVKAISQRLEAPPEPFSDTAVPPAPDYAQIEQAWMAFPGHDSLALSTPPRVAPVDEELAEADVFFVHPTTYTHNDRWNAPFDLAGDYDQPVLMTQASVFNGCCRIYAPRYRQATLKGLGEDRAVALAYSDVARAFEWYLENANHGRPFIIASHSQGTGLAVRLLQEKVIAAGLTDRLVAAYAIGAYVPTTFAEIGLPVCDGASQTGCVVSWNTSKAGRDGAKRLTEKSRYWWQGEMRKEDIPPAVCVNPLTWTRSGRAPATGNPGSLPLPEAEGGVSLPTPARALSQPIAGLTGAQCKDGLLEVELSQTEGFDDILTLLYGSYHRSDYGLFWSALRENAKVRTRAWGAQNPPES